MIDLSKIPCQEASPLSVNMYIPCGRPGAKVVFHQHDGKNVYVMCEGCADHNIRNRRGIELVAAAPIYKFLEDTKNAMDVCWDDDEFHGLREAMSFDWPPEY